VAILWPVASDLLVALLSLHTFRIATLASLATKSEGTLSLASGAPISL
jgi:hypothetical protein